jgi:hypothetical protein
VPELKGLGVRNDGSPRAERWLNLGRNIQLTQVEWRVQLKEYFEDLRNISVPNSEDYQVFDASITLLEDVREIYQKDRTVEER